MEGTTICGGSTETKGMCKASSAAEEEGVWKAGSAAETEGVRKETSVAETKGMRIGIFTCGYQRGSLAQAFADGKRFGYDYVELWGGRPHAFPYDLKQGQLKEVLQLQDTYGLLVEVYTPEHNAYPYNYMIGGQQQWEDAMAYLETALEMGKAMGAQYTLISAGHAGNTASRSEIRKRLLTSLRRLGEKAERLEHKILLEPLTMFESNVCNTANDLAEILSEIDRPWLMGMCDVVVPFVQQEPAMDYFQKLGSRMAHLHLVDSDGVSEAHVLPGDGVMPLQELLGAIRDYGYQGRATIELVTAYLKEPSLYAKRAVDWVRAAMARG